MYPVSEMTYTVSSGTVNPSIPYRMYVCIWQRVLVCGCVNQSINQSIFDFRQKPKARKKEIYTNTKEKHE